MRFSLTRGGAKEQFWSTGKRGVTFYSVYTLTCSLNPSLAGRSRSVSIAIAYVMHKEGISLDIALARVKETRPQADPNHSFMTQLRELESELGLKNI